MVTYKIEKSFIELFSETIFSWSFIIFETFNSSSFERSFSNSCCSSLDNFEFSKLSTKELNDLFTFS